VRDTPAAPEAARALRPANKNLAPTVVATPPHAASTAGGSDLEARLRDAGVDPGRVEELLAGRAAEGLHFRLDVALPGKEASFEVRPGAAQAVDVSSSVTDRRRPVLLVVALVSGVIVLLRLRGRVTLGSFTCLP
jgi:hypothetical protein